MNATDVVSKVCAEIVFFYDSLYLRTQGSFIPAEAGDLERILKVHGFEPTEELLCMVEFELRRRPYPLTEVVSKIYRDFVFNDDVLYLKAGENYIPAQDGDLARMLLVFGFKPSELLIDLVAFELRRRPHLKEINHRSD